MLSKLVSSEQSITITWQSFEAAYILQSFEQWYKVIKLLCYACIITMKCVLWFTLMGSEPIFALSLVKHLLCMVQFVSLIHTCYILVRMKHPITYSINGQFFCTSVSIISVAQMLANKLGIFFRGRDTTCLIGEHRFPNNCLQLSIVSLYHLGIFIKVVKIWK